MMALLNPLALVLLPLVAVLLILNSRRPNSRRSVGNLYLWRQAAEHTALNVSIRRFRRHWLLAVQIAFMVTVLAALARPALLARRADAVFVFDLSGSMSAMEGARSRLDVAKDRALATLEQLKHRRIRIVSAARTAVDRGQFTSQDGAIRNAVTSLSTTAVSAAIADAIALARNTDGADVDVYVFSDRGAAKTADSHLHWMQVGTPGDNLAITALSARPTSGRREQEVLIAVHNDGRAEREAAIDLSLGDRPVAARTIAVAAGSTATVLEHVPASSDALVARLRWSDRLALDNQRFAMSAPDRPVRVRLESIENRFVQQALAANPDVELADADVDVVVCNRCDDGQRQGAGVLRLNDGVATPSTPLVALTLGEGRHEIAQSVSFADAWAAVALGFALPAAFDVVARAGTEPAIVAYEHDGRRAVDVRVDLSRSTLPLELGFPVLIANAVEWLSSRRANPVEVEAGVPLQWRVPDGTGAAAVRVISPDGRSHVATVGDGRLTFAATDLPGIYRVRGLGAEQRFVVNARSDAEPDLSAQPDTSIAPSAGEVARSQTEMATWLIVIAAGWLTLEWVMYRRDGAPRPAATALRAATATWLALAALGVKAPLGTRTLDVVFAVDRSDSIPPRAQAAALTRLRESANLMRSGDRAGLVLFGQDAILERRPAERFQPGDVSSRINGLGTNIERALAIARNALPKGSAGRIVLISDGRQTAGVASIEAARAAADGVRVDVMPVGAETARRLEIAGMSAPADAQVGEPFSVRVDVVGRTAEDRVSLYRDGNRIASETLRNPTAGAASVSFTDVRDTAGLFTYTAAIDGPDDVGDVPQHGAVVAISGAPTVLYVGARGFALPPPTAGFRVERIGGDGLASNAASLARYSTVVLEREAMDRLTPSQDAALDAYVERSGGGLLLLGGAQHGDVGALATSPLGKILPVDFRPRAGQRQTPIGLVLVFDKSGSMADRANGIPKIEIAREAARTVFDVLPPGDSAGVVAFDSTATAAVPFGPARDARDVSDRLREIRPGGSTAIAPAVTMARDWLMRAKLSKRYILLVSDGRTTPADADQLRAALRAGGIELSTVAIGSDADRPLLDGLARESGGRAYFPDDVRQLPAIVARETARAAGGSIVNERFTLRAGSHPIVNGLDRGTLPSLGGYVASVAKPGAATMLASHLDDPVLAGWQAGLGRVAVFTSDLGSSWTDGLRAWPDAGRLWTQTLRWLDRRTSEQPIDLEVLETAGAATLVVRAQQRDGRSINLVGVHAAMRTPGGETPAIFLQPQRPGRYEAALPATATGPYVIEVDARDDSGADIHVVRGFYWGADRELRAVGVDRAALERIASAGGGRILDSHDNPFTGDRPAEFKDLRPTLLTAALVFFLIEIAVRRGLWAPARRRQPTRLPHVAA